MVIALGQDIPLSLKLLKNNKPSTGKDVTVRVVKTEDGTVLLPDTTAPETSEPGLYTFVWTSPPTQKGTVLAVFTTQMQEFTEFIDIIRGFPAGKSENVGIILDSNQVTVGELVEENHVAIGVLEKSQSAIVTESTQEGIESSGQTIGVSE